MSFIRNRFGKHVIARAVKFERVAVERFVMRFTPIGTDRRACMRGTIPSTSSTFAFFLKEKQKTITIKTS